MSKIEVDKVDPQSGTTLTLGTSGDTVSIPSGVTLANAGTVTGIPASAISSGTIATARLGSGTASSSTFLRGDQTFAAAGGGKILQVVQTSKTDTTSLTDTYSFTDISGMSVSITPSATSSKILILSTLNIASGAAAYGANVRLVRDSTGIFIGDAASSRVQATFSTISVDNNFAFPQTINFLDSPSTTSATTYKIQWNITYDNGTPIIYLNRSVTDGDAATNARTPSSIIAIEVGA